MKEVQETVVDLAKEKIQFFWMKFDVLVVNVHWLIAFMKESVYITVYTTKMQELCAVSYSLHIVLV